MGTNYYARFNICSYCNRYDEVHIGKSSMGWTFTFHATDTLRSWSDWKSFLSQNSVMIYNEYGEQINFSDFLSKVESKKTEPHNHAKNYPTDSFLDAEGNSFSEGEFS